MGLMLYTHDLRAERDAALARAEAAEKTRDDAMRAHAEALGRIEDYIIARDKAEAALTAERVVAVEMLTEEQQRHAETQKALIIANTTQANLRDLLRQSEQRERESRGVTWKTHTCGTCAWWSAPDAERKVGPCRHPSAPSAHVSHRYDVCWPADHGCPAWRQREEGR